MKTETVLISFSDVFPRGEHDPDAELTTEANSLFRLGTHCYGVSDPIEAAYLVDLIDRLYKEIAERVHIALEAGQDSPALCEGRRFLEKTQVKVVANSAPRIGRIKNGPDFHLVNLTSGLQLFATDPVSALRYVERKRIKSIYRVPTENHPLFPEGHQFRSSVTLRADEFPEHLVETKDFPANVFGGKDCLFYVVDPEEIQRIKGPMPSFLSAPYPFSKYYPVNTHGELSYVDNFGNIRTFVYPGVPQKTPIEQIEAVCDDAGLFRLQVEGNHWNREARLSTNLVKAPDGELVVYKNPVDPGDSSYLEIVQKWEERRRGGVNRLSAHKALGKPHLGASIRFNPRRRFFPVHGNLWKDAAQKIAQKEADYNPNK